MMVVHKAEIDEALKKAKKTLSALKQNKKEVDKFLSQNDKDSEN